MGMMPVCQEMAPNVECIGSTPTRAHYSISYISFQMILVADGCSPPPSENDAIMLSFLERSASHERSIRSLSLLLGWKHQSG
jgi:hypothetical protein